MADQGYSKVATFMSQQPEFAIFRKFSKLNLQNLLLLQAEITYLEDDLRLLADRDFVHTDRTDYAKDWWRMAGSDNTGLDREQWRKILAIRQKLKEYNKQIAHLMLLSSLRPSKTHDLDFFNKWLELPAMGDFPILSIDHNLWSDPTHADDLFAITRRTSSTPLTHYITNTIIPLVHKLFLSRLKPGKNPLATTASNPTDPESGIHRYSSTRIAKAVSFLSTVTASMLPILSIIILYFIPQKTHKLAGVVCFTFAFAVALVLTTSTRRGEVFTATAAFAAVQVVFITGEDSTPPTKCTTKL